MKRTTERPPGFELMAEFFFVIQGLTHLTAAELRFLAAESRAHSIINPPPTIATGNAVQAMLDLIEDLASTKEAEAN